MTYSNEEFDNSVNVLGNCWKCNQPRHMRRNCLVLGQSRTRYNGRENKDVHCYNCDKTEHYSRDCQLPERTRKNQGSELTVYRVKRIEQEIDVGAQ